VMGVCEKLACEESYQYKTGFVTGMQSNDRWSNSRSQSVHMPAIRGPRCLEKKPRIIRDVLNQDSAGVKPKSN